MVGIASTVTVSLVLFCPLSASLYLMYYICDIHVCSYGLLLLLCPGGHEQEAPLTSS